MRSIRWIPLAAAAVVLLACGFAMVIIANLSDPDAAPADELAVAQPRPPARAEILGGAAVDDAAPAPADALASDEAAVADVVTEVIYTDDLELAHHDVREVLLINGLEPVLTDRLPPVEISDRRANVYNMRDYEPDTIRLEVDVLLDQAPRLRADLARVRSVQTVAQYGPDTFDTPVLEAADGPDDRAVSAEPAAGAIAGRGVDAEDPSPSVPDPVEAVPLDDDTMTASIPPDKDADLPPAPVTRAAQSRPRLQRVIVIVNRTPEATAAEVEASAPASPPSQPADRE